MYPSFDLTWEPVRLSNRDRVVALFLSGRMRLWRGWPVDWDAKALLQQVGTSAHAVVSQAPIQRIQGHSTEQRPQAQDRK